MAARSSWKGYVRVSLVSVPVRAYTASSGSGAEISLNQLHEQCHSRIRYQKVCPIHGEVSSDEIVSGYEYAKDQYVVIDPDEIKQLRPESDNSANVEAFVPGNAIDPVFLTGKTYYLLPDGPVGQKPYQLLCEVMQQQDRHAIARIVLSKREQLVRLRAVDDILAMDVLAYKSSVKEPVGFQDELVKTKSSAQERKLAKQLVDTMARDNLDLGEFTDLYTQRLTQLIEARVAGQELVTPPAVDEPQVINLMDALKASVERAKPKRQTAKRPPKKKVASAKKPAAAQAKRKKKSS
jgi:DNA end-binding protein Ku